MKMLCLILCALTQSVFARSNTESFSRPVIIKGDIAQYQTYEKLAPGSYCDTWPEGVLVYTIDPKSKGLKFHIKKAIAYLSAKTNLRFKEKTPQDKDYIFFTSNSEYQSYGCWSFVGRQGGEQHLNLGKGCENYLTITHEILHAAGIHHEQSRPDRDDYVKIHWSNITEGAESNFQKLPSGYILDHTPYDFDSIMHYGGRDFGIRNKTTISRKNSNRAIRKQSRGLSKLDILGINLLYQKEEENKPKIVFFTDFETETLSERGDKEYPYLYNFKPLFDKSHLDKIEKVTYEIPYLEFIDTNDTPPFDLSLYTDARKFPFFIEVHFHNGKSIKKEFKANYVSKKAFKRDKIDVNYVTTYKNRKYYYNVDVDPGKDNKDLVKAFSVSLKGQHHEKYFKRKEGKYSFRTYSRSEELDIIVHFYLNNGDHISHEVTLRPNIIIDEGNSKKIRVEVKTLKSDSEETLFRLKLEGNLKTVKSVHYDIHPSFGRYSTYSSQKRKNNFQTPVYTTYAKGWETGEVTIDFKDGTQVKKKGVTIY